MCVSVCLRTAFARKQHQALSQIFVMYGARMQMLSVIFARNTGAHKVQAQSSALSQHLIWQRPPGHTHLYVTYCTSYHFKISAHINTIMLPGKSPNGIPDSFYNRKKTHIDVRTHTHTHTVQHYIHHRGSGLTALSK